MWADRVLCSIRRSGCHSRTGIILTSEMGAAHCGIKQKLEWHFFERNLEVFFSFWRSLHSSLLLSHFLCPFWDILPTFSLNSTHDSVPSPYIISTGITFDIGELDQTTPPRLTSFISLPSLSYFYLTTWLNKIHGILRAVYIDTFVYLNLDVLLEIQLSVALAG